MTLISTRMRTRMTSDFSRRAALALIAAGAAGFALPANAVSTQQSERLVTSAIAEINTIINSGKSEAAMIRDFERVFVRYGDVPTIARYTLGADARRASSAQLRSYTSAFQGYMSRKYGRRFREFVGGKLEVQSAKPVKSFVEVKTKATLRGQDPFEVTFLVSDRSGAHKFFNMFIEGVNLLLTERTEIGAMLDRRKGDINALISDLKRA